MTTYPTTRNATYPYGKYLSHPVHSIFPNQHSNILTFWSTLIEIVEQQVEEDDSQSIIEMIPE